MVLCFLTVSTVHATNETFTDLQDMIESSDENTIILDSDYINDMGSSIKITKDITIDGNNHVLDANSKSNIIESTSKLTLKNLVLKNGNSEYGGALDVKNTIIINCTFINNKATYGGAVYIDNGKISNSKFINNNADTGGAVYQTKSTISNSFFTKNSAVSGGAVYQVQSKIKFSKFTFNHAEFGGAVESFFGDVLNSEFINNSAKYEGGALYHFYGNVKNSKFINNTAPNGGAMYRIDCNIENCTFLNNHINDIAPDEDIIDPFENESESSNLSISIKSNESGNPIALLLIGLFIPFRRLMN